MFDEYLRIIIRCVSFVDQYYLQHPVEKHRLEDLKNLKIDLVFCVVKYNYLTINKGKSKQEINVDEVEEIVTPLSGVIGGRKNG